MNKTKKASLALACLVWVSGCASEASRNQLEAYRTKCAQGNQGACLNIPGQEAQNRDEANRNFGMALLLPLLLPVALLAVLAEEGGGGGGGYYVPHHHGFHHHGGFHHGGHR